MNEVATETDPMQEAVTVQDVGLNQLIEAGVHFGHQTRRWNPKMRPYIFTERNGIHIIDLRKTVDRIKAAQLAVRHVVRQGERLLFVCTKRQLRGIIEEEAQRCGAFYVTERWLGGMLTNFQTIRKQIRRLRELERGQEENAFEFYTKKERLLLERERAKLEKYLSGVKEMNRLPGAVFVVDARREIIAVREANRLGIPVIAIADTNADPDLIDFPIPGNDDAIRSVGLISKAIADAVEAAKKEMPDAERERTQEVEATTYSTETGEKRAASADRKVQSRPRRKKRVPLPEVIAQHRRASEEKEEGDEEEVVEAEATDAGTEAAGEDEPIAERADEATPEAEAQVDEADVDEIEAEVDEAQAAGEGTEAPADEGEPASEEGEPAPEEGESDEEEPEKEG